MIVGFVPMEKQPRFSVDFNHAAETWSDDSIGNVIGPLGILRL
jgi:hypothetical protein